MTKNEHVQPGLWDGPTGARPTAGGGSSRRASARKPRPTAVAHDAGELWTIEEVAGYLGVPKQTLYCWRTTGYGPQGFRVGKHLRWRASTVAAWVVELEQRS